MIHTEASGDSKKFDVAKVLRVSVPTYAHLMHFLIRGQIPTYVKGPYSHLCTSWTIEAKHHTCHGIPRSLNVYGLGSCECGTVGAGSLKSIRQIGSLEIYVGVDGAVIWIWNLHLDLYVVIFMPNCFFLGKPQFLLLRDLQMTEWSSLTSWRDDSVLLEVYWL